MGGADTHRFGLDDMVLIKDNHIAACGTPLEALKKAKENTSFSKKIEIEVETLDDAIIAEYAYKKYNKVREKGRMHGIFY